MCRHTLICLSLAPALSAAPLLTVQYIMFFSMALRCATFFGLVILLSQSSSGQNADLASCLPENTDVSKYNHEDQIPQHLINILKQKGKLNIHLGNMYCQIPNGNRCQVKQ